MKNKNLKLAVALAVVVVGTSHAEVNFQKVYELPGMTATEIKEAFGTSVIDVGQGKMGAFSDSMDIVNGNAWMADLSGIKKAGNVRCNISVVSWLPDVNEWYTADVVVQSKAERVRVSVSNLPIHGAGKASCVSSIEKHLDNKFASLKTLDNNW